MSQLILKQSVFKNLLRHTNNVRLLSSTPTYPFKLIEHLLTVRFSIYDDDDRVTCWSTYNMPNSCKQKRIMINDKKLREEFTDAMTCGFTHNGSLRFHETTGNDNTVRIVIEHEKNLEAESTYRMRKYLPPLPSGSKILNLAMSSLPERDEDWAVCVKFQGSRLSLYRHRPSGKSEWINIKPMHESISPFSSIMFSKKDQKFYVPSPGGKNLFALDPHFKEEEVKPKFFYLQFEKLAKLVVGELDDLSSCSRTDHLVESPTGELFLVKWYGDDVDYENSNLGVTSLIHKTQQFMVFREFREEETKNLYYIKVEAISL
ncbi:unnamed protein product [Microthlaspi erraticum]|uniref:F-box associated domain-containing protein n=1 Tax=Microthlaspi erraticum TaxID=1685480 RepID=A0A6D2HMI1_9BRAS|nr:unnamed protein product [Microthlaspi erraticum]